MAFGTKINLNDSKSQQLSGQTLSLSGITHTYGQLIVNSGATLTILPNHGTGKVLTSNALGVATWQTPTVNWSGITGAISGNTALQIALSAKTNVTTFNFYTGTTAPNTYVCKTDYNAFTGATYKYNLDSPSVCTVGGLLAGAILTGKTAFEILSAILVPELFGVLTNPSSSISANPSGTFEIGCTISTLCITACFNRGSITPQYCSASPFRSGPANTYCFSGCQVVGAYACSTSPVVKCATNYVICATQTWGVCVAYDCGDQPKGSKGTNFNSPLIAGNSNVAAVTLSGIYPYYSGKVTNGSRPAVTNSLVTGGTKVVGSSVGTVTVTFGSTGQWTWLAIPATSASRVKWFVNNLDCGFVSRGCASDKYPDECQLCITSGQGCWSNICYKVYMSGFAASDSSPMEFRLS
jgi:hypothetical protein